VSEVELLPFFLSRAEMTQAQWLAATGARPSDYRAPGHGVHPVSDAHPAEQMSWDEADETLRRLGLLLPTEAQWEYACRAGTGTPWWPGADLAELDGAANVADLHARDHGGSAGWSYAAAEQAGLDDGHTIHAPVASFRGNAFGLHDVHGNVWEWCRDLPASYVVALRSGDGARIIPPEIGDIGTRLCRGGAFSNPPARARSATRWNPVRSFRSNVIGVRPARGLQR
jgi:formylglycine-generating enzyme required for sulfatase activity